MQAKGVKIKPAPETADTFELLQRVSRGEERITVADSDIGAAASPFAPNIHSPCKLPEKQPIAWGVRKDKKDLKAALDAFLVEHALTEFKGEPHLVDLEEIKKRKVWVGAQGLMQLMPRTAQELKVRNVVEPSNGILAGVMLMARYSAWFNSPEIPAKDRIRFALASYNCGPGHVQDARAGQGHGAQPEQVVRQRRALDAALEAAGRRQEGTLRILPLRRARQLREPDPEPLRQLRQARALAVTSAGGPQASAVVRAR
jgi:membrane-bound lytic murein transglycosylase MltF